MASFWKAFKTFFAGLAVVCGFEAGLEEAAVEEARLGGSRCCGMAETLVRSEASRHEGSRHGGACSNITRLNTTGMAHFGCR